MNETTSHSNIQWHYEGILSKHSEYFGKDAKIESFNADALKVLLDLEIYCEHVSPKSFEHAKNRMDWEYGFKGFTSHFFLPGHFYTLNMSVRREIHKKLQHFIRHINPPTTLLKNRNEVISELSKIKNYNEKVEYLEYIKLRFEYSNHNKKPPVYIIDQLDIVETGILQQHLCDKIYNYDIPILKKWAKAQETEDFILYVENLIFQYKMQADGKIIYDSSLNARQKVILLDKLVRMDVNEWEVNGARKHARIFDLILPNSESYILDILKEINSSKKGRITSDYEEINTLYNSIVN